MPETARDDLAPRDRAASVVLDSFTSHPVGATWMSAAEAAVDALLEEPGLIAELAAQAAMDETRRPGWAGTNEDGIAVNAICAALLARFGHVRLTARYGAAYAALAAARADAQGSWMAQAVRDGH